MREMVDPFQRSPSRQSDFPPGRLYYMGICMIVELIDDCICSQVIKCWRVVVTDDKLTIKGRLFCLGRASV